MSIDYCPPITLAKFMLDSDHYIRVAVGPLGSGKSMACIFELLRRAREQVPYDGLRYTRFAIVRNTMQQLRGTVLSDVRLYLGPMATYYVTDSTIRIRAMLDDGTMVYSDWVLIPLDVPEDQQRLLSMQLTGAWINELREVPFEIIDPLLGRLGRYPPKSRGGATWEGLICDSNPWSTDSPYHEVTLLAPNPLWALYHQPSGLSPDAENVPNLPDGYYERLASGKDSDWIAVHVGSEWGTSNAGQAVFRKSFHSPTHVRDMQVVVNPFRPLLIGLDFGRTPTALIGQVDGAGRFLIFKEIVTQGMGIIQMLVEHLKPALMEYPFAGHRYVVVGDPAGKYGSQIGEETPFSVLAEHGFAAVPAPTNALEPRLTSVERALRTQILGEPGLQISRAGCPMLVRAMGNMYRFRKRRDGQFEDTPEKLHPWSDLADALQYFCLGAAANLSGKAFGAERSRPKLPRRVSAGWT